MSWIYGNGRRDTENNKSNRQMLQGICVVCGTKKSIFISASGKGLSMTQSTVFHLKCTCRVTTSQDLARNWTNVWMRIWLQRHGSKPINRVNKAAYHHGICYVKNKDAKTHNEVCDKNMLTEFNGIYNPTLRERMERGVVSTIIGKKKRFGWGLKKRAQRERQLGFSISWWTL